MKPNKQSIAYLLMTFLFFYSSTSILNAHSYSRNQASDKIALRLNSNTRPAFSFSMDATKYESSIEVFIDNYDGEVEIFIEGTNIYNSLNIDGSGTGIIDISNLVQGRTYNLLLVVGGWEFIGSFVK